MHVTRLEQRAYIKITVLRGRNARECHSELVEAVGNNALPYRTAMRWVLVLRLFSCRQAVLIESHSFFTTLDLKLGFFRPLCYHRRVQYPPLQYLRIKSAILAGANYFLAISFKCEGKYSCHDLILNPRKYQNKYLGFAVVMYNLALNGVKPAS